MNTTKLIAAVIVIALIGLPSLSFARARGGGYGGGYSSGSRSGSPSGASAAADHAPMNRTEQSRLNSRRHPNHPQPPHHQRPTALSYGPAGTGHAALVYATESFVGWPRSRRRRIMDRPYAVRRNKQQCCKYHRGRRDRRGHWGFQFRRDTPPSPPCRRRSLVLFSEGTATRS